LAIDGCRWSQTDLVLPQCCPRRPLVSIANYRRTKGWGPTRMRMTGSGSKQTPADERRPQWVSAASSAGASGRPHPPEQSAGCMGRRKGAARRSAMAFGHPSPDLRQPGFSGLWGCGRERGEPLDFRSRLRRVGSTRAGRAPPWRRRARRPATAVDGRPADHSRHGDAPRRGRCRHRHRRGIRTAPRARGPTPVA
jgi:hypothetical protein